MRQSGFLRAALVGALVGVLVVLAVAAAARYGLLTRVASLQRSQEAGTLVTLVLPAEDGVLTPRVIVYYPPGSSAGYVIDPKKLVAQQGAGAQSLADAYAFGSGDGLAAAYAEAAGIPTPKWLIVYPGAWSQLAAGRSITVTLPVPLEVFNGVELVSFPAGPVAIDASQTPLVLSGTDHVSADQRGPVLVNIAADLQKLLIARGTLVPLSTNAPPDALASWQLSLSSRPQPQLRGR